MTPSQLVQTLQMTDSLFPVGGYAYSDGLETAASAGLVHDAGTLAAWLDHYVQAVFIPCEGLALLKCMRASETGDWDTIRVIDEELSALKPAAAARSASRSIGRRLLTASALISEKARPPDGPPAECNAAVAYGLVFKSRGISAREAILAFGYTRLAGIVSAGMRLIAIGHQNGQILLAGAIERLPDAADQIFLLEHEPLRSFNPILDVQQMNHRYVYSRLFRS
jgi:urease accessory protein